MQRNTDYRECMAEITAVLNKYDMAGAVTVVSKERAMFNYHFPKWSCITIENGGIRFNSKKIKKDKKETVELSCHIIMQMRDIAVQTFGMTDQFAKVFKDKLKMEHDSYQGFDPEYEQ